MSKEKKVTKLENEIKISGLESSNLKLKSSRPFSDGVKLEIERLDLLIKTKENELARMKLNSS